jgi:hypothetical protein
MHQPVEVEVLQLCSRAQLDRAAVDRIKELLGENPNWDYLCKIAQRHGMLPLLYYQLNKTARDRVPVDYLTRLKLIYQENAARNLILTAELLSIVQELRSKAIESLPFKGPALAMMAYGDLALRCFVDLDLIVRRRDVAAAREVLIARGYRPTRKLSPQQEQLLLASQHNIRFSRDEGRMIVELHWRVAAGLYSASVDEEELWANLETITLDNVKLKTLSPEELVYSLCIHGSRHLWERLSWIGDVAALISHRMIDWERLLQLSEKNRTEGMLFLGLQLAHDLCGASMPDHVRVRIAADSDSKRLAIEIAELLFRGPEYVRLSSLKTFKYNLRMRKSWSARARYCAFAISPSDDDLDAIALPRFLNFGYYLLRPIRLLRRRRAISRTSGASIASHSRSLK